MRERGVDDVSGSDDSRGLDPRGKPSGVQGLGSAPVARGPYLPVAAEAHVGPDAPTITAIGPADSWKEGRGYMEGVLIL